jgi:hypothetical protein
MLESVTRHAAWTVALMAAAPLAAQDRLPRAAGDSVEVKLTVEGTAEVPAQSYGLSVLLVPRPGTQLDLGALGARLEALEMPARETCLASFPMGFISNPIETSTVDLPMPDDEDLEADAEANAFAAASYYSGMFASRETAQEAQRLLRESSQAEGRVQPMLFDCEAAFDEARLAALRKSAAEADQLADALRLRNAGVTRIESATSDPNQLLLDVMRNAQSDTAEAAETVKVNASLTVTYRLER